MPSAPSSLATNVLDISPTASAGLGTKRHEHASSDVSFVVPGRCRASENVLLMKALLSLDRRAAGMTPMRANTA